MSQLRIRGGSEKDLTDATDRYMASHPHNDKSKAFAVGQSPQAMMSEPSFGFTDCKSEPWPITLLSSVVQTVTVYQLIAECETGGSF